MSVRPGPEIFESQLQRMLHVLKTGMEYYRDPLEAPKSSPERRLGKIPSQAQGVVTVVTVVTIVTGIPWRP